jgi:hypothetical protein
MYPHLWRVVAQSDMCWMASGSVWLDHRVEEGQRGREVRRLEKEGRVSSRRFWMLSWRSEYPASRRPSGIPSGMVHVQLLLVEMRSLELFLWLFLNLNSPDLCLQSTWDYRRESLHLAPWTISVYQKMSHDWVLVFMWEPWPRLCSAWGVRILCDFLETLGFKVQKQVSCHCLVPVVMLPFGIMQRWKWSPVLAWPSSCFFNISFGGN